jgi:hypothetical protein
VPQLNGAKFNAPTALSQQSEATRRKAQAAAASNDPMLRVSSAFSRAALRAVASEQQRQPAAETVATAGGEPGRMSNITNAMMKLVQSHRREGGLGGFEGTNHAFKPMQASSLKTVRTSDASYATLTKHLMASYTPGGSSRPGRRMKRAASAAAVGAQADQARLAALKASPLRRLGGSHTTRKPGLGMQPRTAAIATRLGAGKTGRRGLF